jgi:hypothetical protein
MCGEDKKNKNTTIHIEQQKSNQGEMIKVDKSGQVKINNIFKKQFPEDKFVFVDQIRDGQFHSKTTVSTSYVFNVPDIAFEKYCTPSDLNKKFHQCNPGIGPFLKLKGYVPGKIFGDDGKWFSDNTLKDSKYKKFDLNCFEDKCTLKKKKWTTSFRK